MTQIQITQLGTKNIIRIQKLHAKMACNYRKYDKSAKIIT